MDVYTLLLAPFVALYAAEARRAWQQRQTIRRETAMIDQELDFLI